VTLVVILTHLTRVSGAAAAVSHRRCRPRADGAPGPRDAAALTPSAAAVAGWSRMRGTTTFVTALALSTSSFESGR
jgi:hypothetical protein